MMKNLLFALFFFGILSSHAQEMPLDFEGVSIVSPEPGKCYYFCLANPNSKYQTPEKSFIIEIFSPKFKEVEVTLFLKDFESEFEKHKMIRHQTSPAHVKFVRKDANTMRGFNIETNPNSSIYCLVEMPGQYKSISAANFENGSMKIVKKKLVEKAKMTKTYVDEEPNIITENQSYFPEGYSLAPQELILPTICGSYTIRNIQEKLIELGYDLEANNILNERTKFALIHFQRKNGLKEGALDLETIKMLGVEY